MIAVITYDAPHRKTQDLLVQLKLNGYKDIQLVVIPWVERKNFQPLFQHRPSNRVDIKTETLCERLSLEFSKTPTENLHDFFEKNPFEYILIAGAGILPEDLAKNHRVINSHPGFLPNMKGLDAFKWAIYQGQPLGVTTHYISEKADEGELIERRKVPVYFEDSFHNLAYRVYETEIEMLVNSIEMIKSKKASLESLADNNFSANRRMPHHLERIMMVRFEELRKGSPSFRKIMEE